MTKALLSSRGVEFEARDVSNADALAELRALGIMSVPAVVVGESSMTGWNPSRLAELVGFAYQERTAPPEELIGSIAQIVNAALRVVGQVPDDCWEMTAPGRPRPLRELARHVFDVIERGVDADVLSIFPAGTWLIDRDAPGLDSARLLVRYGEAVRAKFTAWYTAPLDPTAFGRTIDADVGPRTLTQVLERTRSHAGQHLRQLYAFLGWCGVEADNPLTDADLRQMGLDLPIDVF